MSQNAAFDQGLYTVCHSSSSNLDIPTYEQIVKQTCSNFITGWLGINPRPAEPGRIYPGFANSTDPDQLASSEANWSGSTLFEIKYVTLY